MLTRVQSRMQDLLNRVVRDGVKRFGASEGMSTVPLDEQNARSSSSSTSFPQDMTLRSSRQLPPSVINISLDSSSLAGHCSISSTSYHSHITNHTRQSFESHISPISHPSLYSHTLCDDLVDDYVM